MIPVYGRIKDSVNLAVMQNKWQQKKKDINEGKNVFHSAEERELKMLQDQADQIRESRSQADIDAKLAAGSKLTADEIDYLRKNAPQKLKEYEELQKERETYKDRLKNCKTKEEVEEVKMTKMGQFMASCKEISSNPNIPKGAKLAMLQKLVRQVAGIEAEHLEFEQSLQYAQLPEDEEERKRRKENKEYIEADDEPKEGLEESLEFDADLSVSPGDVKKALGKAIQKNAGDDTAESETGIFVDAKIGDGQMPVGSDVKNQEFHLSV